MYETTDDLVLALEKAGAPVEMELNLDTRSHLGTALALRRNPPYQHTLVAAGNWYIRVMDPDFAPRVAKALHAVVLKPLGKTSSPSRPPHQDQFSEIPDKPAYKNLDALADKVDAAVGCTDREMTTTTRP
ncbi:hypothetical protein [Streptomyces nigra]|uniref:hypothetical protein n=1 Tax=Streptomyces nigra TaxID=1827580 RepID=UPI0035DA92F6